MSDTERNRRGSRRSARSTSVEPARAGGDTLKRRADAQAEADVAEPDAALRISGSLASDSDSITSLEGHVLAVTAASVGPSAYQVMKALSSSLGGSLPISTGTVYPIVRRLRGRGLLTSTPTEGSGRKAEGLFCTPAGLREARAWISALSAADVVPPDPLRSKVALLHLLEPQQRVRWLASAGRAIDDRLEGLRANLDLETGPSARDAKLGEVATLSARRRWLQDVLLSIEL